MQTVTTGTAQTITDAEYKRLRAMYDAYDAAQKAQYPGVGCFTQEMMATLPQSPTNAERSAIEVYEFVHNRVEGVYIMYLSQDCKRVTTWTGETLGTVVKASKLYRSNFGDERVAITAQCIDGRTYRGTAYGGGGFYAQMRPVE